MGGIIYLVGLVVVVIAVLSLLGLGENGIRGQIMNTTNPAVPDTGSYVDWPAIIAGTVVPVAINLLLIAFGATRGLSSITLEGSDKSSKLELMLTALWIILTLIVSYLAGGYIAGRMRRRIETASTGRSDRMRRHQRSGGLGPWHLLVSPTGVELCRLCRQYGRRGCV